MAYQYARAVHPFTASEPTDLPFNAGEILKVLRRDESGWWVGQKENGDRGDFPYNYVEIISREEQRQMRDNRTRQLAERQMQSSGVSRVQVVNVKNSTDYRVTVTVAAKEHAATKNMSNFRQLDEDLRNVFPEYDSPLPPMWADNIYMSEDTSKERSLVLEHYLFKLTGNNNEVAEYLLVKWVAPKANFNISPAAQQYLQNSPQSGSRGPSRNNFQGGLLNVFPLAKVGYDWTPNDAVELGLKKGEIIAIRNKETSSQGWWEGETAVGQRGLFPSNYVFPLNPTQAKQAVLGQKVTRDKPIVKKSSKNRKKKTMDWSMPSLQAFDELLNEGYTMVKGSKLFNKRNTPDSVNDGDKVSVEYTGYIWDCQTQKLVEFASSDLPDRSGNVGPLKFVVGRGETIRAIELAVTFLVVNDTVRVVVRPDLGYGEVGSPPLIPPNCHLVYDITLESKSGSAIPGPPAMEDHSVHGLSGFRSPASSFDANDWDNMKSTSLVDAVQAQARAMAQQGAPVNRGAPVSQRAGRNRERPRGYASENDKRSNEKVKKNFATNKKYDLMTMREVVRTKQYEMYGVDPTYIEDQLTDAAFQQAFRMDRSKFLLLPRWKQVKLKKEQALY